MNGPNLSVAEIAELAGGLAHELRNPLSTMMVNLKLLAEDLQEFDARPEDIRRRALLKVDVVRKEAERLQHLFEDFLNLAGPCRLRRESLDLNSAVARLVTFFEPMANNQGIKFLVAARAGPVHCAADEQLLSQALLNIVINAQQAMPKGGTIEINTDRVDGCAVIEVADTGVGIAPNDLSKILRPFFSTKPGGTGLGLSITQRIVSEHGGTLDFKSEVGRGTRVTIRIPLEATMVGT